MDLGDALHRSPCHTGALWLAAGARLRLCCGGLIWEGGGGHLVASAPNRILSQPFAEACEECQAGIEDQGSYLIVRNLDW
jgi:hypothetical protein